MGLTFALRTELLPRLAQVYSRRVGGFVEARELDFEDWCDVLLSAHCERDHGVFVVHSSCQARKVRRTEDDFGRRR